MSRRQTVLQAASIFLMVLAGRQALADDPQPADTPATHSSGSAFTGGLPARGLVGLPDEAGPALRPDPEGLTSPELTRPLTIYPEQEDEPWLDAPEPAWDVPDDSEPYWRTNLFRRVANDQLYLVRSWLPGEVMELEFSIPLLVAVAGARSSVTRGADYRLQRSLEDWTRGEREDTARLISRIGDADSAIAALGAAYLVARWSDNERLSRATSLSAEALLDAAILSTALKAATRRTRPADGGTGEFFGVGVEPGQSTTSFPSGHATGAFAVATVLASEYRDKRWVVWTVYGTAGLIALSRVGLGRHFPSDVVAGAVLGRSIGRMVAERGGIGPRETFVSRLEPFVDPETGGIGVAYRRRW